MLPQNPESGNIAPQEKISDNLRVEVIDQDHQNYPYKISDKPPYLQLMDDLFSLGQPVSQEGFFHNEPAHRNAGRHIANLLKLPPGSRVIDIGWGRNLFIADGLKSAELDVSLLDYGDDKAHPDPIDPLTVPPISTGDYDGKFHKFVGNIADISHPSSVLKNEKFDLAIFNGSWLSGGYNNTVSESLEARLHQKYGNNFPGYNDPRVIADLDEYRQHVLSRVRDHISEGGYVYFGSSRFAYHGAGYEFGNYPEEKLNQLDLIAQMVALGARKATIIGMTNEKMQEALDFNLHDPKVKAEREAQIIKKLIFPSFGGSKAEVALTVDGKSLSYDELEAYATDPEKRAMFLQNLHVSQRVEDIEGECRALGEQILAQLTGGVLAIPDTFKYSSMNTHERSQRIKKATENIMPNDIARIDALAFQF